MTQAVRTIRIATQDRPARLVRSVHQVQPAV